LNTHLDGSLTPPMSFSMASAISSSLASLGVFQGVGVE
jgi:hypothetical protein